MNPDVSEHNRHGTVLSSYLTAPRYVLGEAETDHSTIENLHDRARDFQMVPQPTLWGWGTVRRTERTPEEMAIESGSATMSAAAIDPKSVDALVLCSTRFPGGADEHGRFVETIAKGIGLVDPAYLGITLNRCTNLLVAIGVAGAFVSAGRHRRVLVITTDRVADESERMENFALFSDGAASCLVTGDGDRGDYEIVSVADANDTSALDWSNEISADLARQANDRLLAPLGMTPADIAGLMHANLFKPLVVMKERQAGFTLDQIFTDNITRFGHCFAADPLINLVDQETAGKLTGGLHYMLVSSVPGSRVAVLIRKVARP